MSRSMIKLLVNEWEKTYTVINVNNKCRDISPNIETVGMMTGIKIKDDNDLFFKINYLKEMGFNKEE